MILIDQKALVDADKSVQDQVNRAIQEIMSEKDEVCFQDPRTLSKKGRRKLNDGRYEKLKEVCVPLIDKTVLNGRGISVAYVDGIPEIKDGKYVIRRKRMWVDGVLTLFPKKNAELIWFLRNVSSKVVGKSTQLIERNTEKENEDRLKEIQGDSAIKFMITNEHSPISKEKNGSEEMMRTLAASWNVTEADKITYSELQLRLFDAVVASEKNKSQTKRGYSEFIKDIESIEAGDSEEIVFKNNVQKAIEKKIIVCDSANHRWTYGDRELMRYSGQDSPIKFERLVNYLVNNEGEYKLICTDLFGAEEQEQNEPSEENLIAQIQAETNNMKLKSLCTKYELDKKGGNDILKERLVAHLNK